MLFFYTALRKLRGAPLPPAANTSRFRALYCNSSAVSGQRSDCYNLAAHI
ncbi:Protein of unknown function D [Prunus dulcis]|uniref:Uncharacterized protein n=1 Tax=Prunus dulcis TaxID=3755 RepID=A0A5H2XSX2_PRUDU|nr:Protein of unknown function D [Prunus dulcis]